jgi:large subunit ribosomal protein L4
MPTAALYNAEGIKVGDVDLREDIFGVPVNEHILHQAVVRHLANQRSGTADTKDRGEVRGGGRKPWRQKGTGRARAGSNRSPIWRGGGVTFGPGPRSYVQAMPKKMRRLAVKSALSVRVEDGDLMVIEEFQTEVQKTREYAKLLNAMEAKRGALLVTESYSPLLERLTRNLPGVQVALASELNAYDLLAFNKVILSKTAVDTVGEVLANA